MSSSIAGRNSDASPSKMTLPSISDQAENGSKHTTDVLFVVGGLNVGGTERHLLAIARTLRREGWRVAVYSLAGDGPLRSDFETASVQIMLPPVNRCDISDSMLLRAGRMSLTAIHLQYVMARMRPNIAHFFLPAAYIIGGIAAMIARIEIRVMSRRSLNLYQRGMPGIRFVERYLHQTMAAVLGNSCAVVAELRKERVPEERLALIYNGIACEEGQRRTRSETRALLQIDETTLIIIIVANLIPYKGHLDLIEALGLVGDQIGPPWRLLVVGRDDGIGSAVRSAAKSHGIDDRIDLLGVRQDVPDLLAASDIGLLCSHEEGFSNAILEGMAAGLPMIVTDVGGNAEAVLDGQTGCVVSPHDPAALANAIALLSREPALRARYGAAGRARFEAMFTLDTCVTRYRALYRGLISGRRPLDIPEIHEHAI